MEDVPSDFIIAVSHANMVLSWMENLPRKEQPPRWMWPFPDELDEFFEEVEIAREQRFNKSSSGEDSPGMVKNEFFDDK